MASYNIIENNRTFTCANGIYLDTVDDNIITNNLCTTGTLNGIYITASDRNKITNNTVTANDSNTANPQGGVYIDADSDYNIVSSNSITNNNNAGIGSTYGVYIANANCGNTVVSDNVVTGNDATYLDSGTQTDIIYFCSTITDITDAITSIGANKGQIIIGNGTFTLTSNINIAGGGTYIIEGQGDATILHSDDFIAFNITSAIYCSIKNLKIDATGCTTATRGIVTISSTGVYLDNVTIVGGSTKGRDIYVSSNYATIKNCALSEALYGIYIDGADYTKITDNRISAMDTAGINLEASSTDSSINNNNITDCGTYGIAAVAYCDRTTIVSNIVTNNAAGIFMNGGSTGVVIDSNSIETNSTYGVYTNGLACTVCANSFYNNVRGVYIYDSVFTVTGNTFKLNGAPVTSNISAIELRSSSSGTVSGNTIYNSTSLNSATDIYGIFGETLLNSSIIGNMIFFFKNTGAGTGYGIALDANCQECTVMGNSLITNDSNLSDAGTNTLKQTAAADPYNNLV